ncbi:MAG TPA: hypothetical protein PKK43_15880, partial [Spirochaetota bacterium]|nr:hypothetical protein [Spirochaetota bacterium]
MKRVFGKPGILPIVFCAIALIHIIRIEYTSFQLTPAMPMIAGSAISIAFIFCLGRICESIPHTPLRAVFSGLILFLFCGMNSYRMSNGVSLDYALISDNIGLGFSFEAVTVIFSVFRKFEIFTWFASVPATAAVLMIAKRKSEPRDVRPARIPLYLAIMTAIVILPVPTRDEISYFIRGGIAYGSVRDVKVEGYPLMKGTIGRSAQGKALSAGSDHPNVFIVMIESFNANFVEARYANGQEYTPFFNSMISKGLYVEHFYGNSVQTCKGQEATLF